MTGVFFCDYFYTKFAHVEKLLYLCSRKGFINRVHSAREKNLGLAAKVFYYERNYFSRGKRNAPVPFE